MQPRTQQHAQPQKQEEGAYIGGEDPDNRFLSHHKRKTEEEKEREFCNL